MDNDQSIFDLHLDGESKRLFRSISIWVTLVAVCGFITLASSCFTYAKLIYMMQAILPYNMMILYCVALLVYVIMAFFLNYFLFQFGSNSRKAMVRNDQQHFNAGLRNFKLYIRFLGILIIVVICFVLLVFVAGMLLK